MPSSSADPNAAPDPDLAPRAGSHAGESRAVATAARTATLCTTARDPAGFPFGSLVTVASDTEGRILLLLSRLAEHTQNLAADARASLLLVAPAAPGESPLAVARVTLIGRCLPVPEAEREPARAAFLAAHPDAAAYAGFADFAFFRLDPVAVRYVGGFGRMSWVSADAYRAAGPR